MASDDQDPLNNIDDETPTLLPRYLVLVVSFTVIGMSLFELIKLSARPYINNWESLLLTVLFSALLSGFATYFAVLRFIKLNKQLTREIEKRRKLERELVIAASVDKLTQIYNRRKIEEIIQAEIERARRYNTPLSVIMIDLDDFKMINDTYGHHVGDNILRTVAGILKTNIRTTDAAGRWGGEEFMIVVPATTLDNTRGLAEKIRHIIATHRYDHSCTITISMGISQMFRGDSFDSFINRADDALYRAKNRGKNRVEAYF
ncbi:MAG TPA: GGDEF domain-containing protein [Nitrospirota bacterium]|nr:GGDEF domain-containing protein [Nitrospirota bacterium]